MAVPTIPNQSPAKLPPVSPRGEDFFDPGAKYHVPGNTPYTRYFLARITPDAGAHLAKLKSGAGPVMALPAEAF